MHEPGNDRPETVGSYNIMLGNEKMIGKLYLKPLLCVLNVVFPLLPL